MSVSNEEEREIVKFIENNRLNRVSLNMQEKWEELGKKLNRDWKTIYKLYTEGEFENNGLAIKLETDDIEDEVEDVSIEQNETTAESNTIAGLPSTSNENEDEEIIQYVTLDGGVVNLDDFDQFILCDTSTVAAINNEVEEISAKRKLDLNDFDRSLLNTLKEQGREELEMQREEHNKKMKLLKMQIEHGAEIHNEKMKILKTKLKSVQQQIHHIDHVICNKRLTKKFKSGPI